MFMPVSSPLYLEHAPIRSSLAHSRMQTRRQPMSEEQMHESRQGSTTLAYLQGVHLCLRGQGRKAARLQHTVHEKVESWSTRLIDNSASFDNFKTASHCHRTLENAQACG